MGGGNRNTLGYNSILEFCPKVGKDSILTEEDSENLLAMIWNNPNLKGRLDKLEGRTLLCSCSSNGFCHADRLLSLLEMKKDISSPEFYVSRSWERFLSGGQYSSDAAIASTNLHHYSVGTGDRRIVPHTDVRGKSGKFLHFLALASKLFMSL